MRGTDFNHINAIIILVAYYYCYIFYEGAGELIITIFINNYSPKWRWV